MNKLLWKRLAVAAVIFLLLRFAALPCLLLMAVLIQGGFENIAIDIPTLPEAALDMLAALLAA